jgi:hypothetical protein
MQPTQKTTLSVRNERLHWVDEYFYRWFTASMMHLLLASYVYTNLGHAVGIAITVMAALRFCVLVVCNTREGTLLDDEAALFQLRRVQFWIFRVLSFVMLGFMIWLIAVMIQRLASV